MSKSAEAARVKKWREANPERNREISRKANKKLYDKRQEEKYLARLRDEFAMAALSEVLSKYFTLTKKITGNGQLFDEYVERLAFVGVTCYHIADVMLEARK